MHRLLPYDLNAFANALITVAAPKRAAKPKRRTAAKSKRKAPKRAARKKNSG